MVMRVDKFFRLNERLRQLCFGDDEQAYVPNRYRKHDELTIDELSELDKAKGADDEDN